MPIPLPPREEVIEICNIFDNYFKKERALKSLLKIERVINQLKQSILSKAFRGELGTNDPTEENAIELLKSILTQQQG